MNDGSKRAVYAAFGANSGIAVAKFVGALLTGSAGMLAEAVHSAADAGNQALLLLGGKRAKRSPNAEFQFGFGRERYFWSFVVALVLFSMGGLFALYEGVQKLLHPHEPSKLYIAIGILVVAIVLETFSLTLAIKEANHVKPKSLSWWKFIKTTKQPELAVVLLEDVGAEVGLFVALGGVITAHYTHDARWDAIGSLTIGILLIVIALLLAVEMKGLLMGESALPEQQELIERALQDDPRVRSIVHLRTMHLGPDEILLTAKIDFIDTLSVQQLAQAINDAKVRARSVVDATLRIYIESDIRR
ncbi:MAG: cation diffusion facilitator family transporter [Actinobacteria bacterium]|nr:cation diffusion facilitator family transporter [Actinomycetota bacterium]